MLLNKVNARFLTYLGIAVIAPILGAILLFLIHLLPTAPMAQNVYHSLDMLKSEFSDEILVDGYKASLTGVFTDCLMLEHAIYNNEEHSKFEQAMLMYRGESYDSGSEQVVWHPGDSLVDYLHGVQQPKEVAYSRYWHGYLLLLKPLLLLGTVNTIVLLNGAVQLLCIGVVLILLQKKEKSYVFSIGFLGAIPFLTYISIYASLSLSICFYLMIFAVLTLLMLDEKLIQKDAYGVFFFVVGIITSYMDFLTYPLVTVGFPLCFYLYLHGEDIKKACRRVISFSIAWVIGYGWMWMSKWILADLFFHSGIIQDAIKTIFQRTDSASGQGRIQGFVQVVSKNMGAYTNKGFGLYGLLILIVLVFVWKRVDMKKVQSSVPVMLVACYPFAWWFLMQNHSDEHWVFTCRIFSITVFAILTVLAKIENNTRKIKGWTL
ncbi:MAG: hypothetical protein K6G30_13660 [Acetatifactor sp.]|nr:hypothetical protein [Acetatifactor sp.]